MNDAEGGTCAVRSGGAGKAETAKLPGAEIGPKPCPGNARQKKSGPLPWEDRWGIGPSYVSS
jgi:hypothetical protein